MVDIIQDDPQGPQPSLEEITKCYERMKQLEGITIDTLEVPFDKV